MQQKYGIIRTKGVSAKITDAKEMKALEKAAKQGYVCPDCAYEVWKKCPKVLATKKGSLLENCTDPFVEEGFQIWRENELDGYFVTICQHFRYPSTEEKLRHEWAKRNSAKNKKDLDALGRDFLANVPGKGRSMEGVL